MANLTTTTSAVFIPEIWLPEIQAFRRANLVAANRVKNINFVGRAGDVLHIPKLTELTANNKAANTAVSFQSPTETEFTMTIATHKEVSFLIEEITRVQSAYDLRREYTSNGGYVLAKSVDTSILALASSLAGADIVVGADGITAYSGANESDLAAAGVRRMLETLDTRNVDRAGLSMIVHPSQMNVLLAIDRFTEYQIGGSFAAEQNTRGLVGQAYGVPVYMTTNVAAGASADWRNLLMHRDSVILATQRDVSINADYLVEQIGWAVVMDEIYQASLYRSTEAISFVTPA